MAIHTIQGSLITPESRSILRIRRGTSGCSLRWMGCLKGGRRQQRQQQRLRHRHLARSLRHRHRLVPRRLLLLSTILWMATMPSTSSSARTPRRPPLRLLEPQREGAASTTTIIRLHLRGRVQRTRKKKRKRTSSTTASATARATATVSRAARCSARLWRSPRARCGTLWLNESVGSEHLNASQWFIL